jgi:hypothetical protein
MDPSAFFVPAGGVLWHPLRIIAAPSAIAAHIFIGLVPFMVVLHRFLAKPLLQASLAI